jgi:NADH:ubiquinone oxidoreductase subunit 5 (subunit L)/multisubunit Na+/H+ antiporter MnhA subunit
MAPSPWRPRLDDAVFWLAALGVALSWFFYLKRPDIPAAIKERAGWLYTLLDNKYYFDKFNEVFFAGGARCSAAACGKGATRASSTASSSMVRHTSSAICNDGSPVPDRSHLPLRFYDDYRRVRLDDPLGHARLS